MHTTYTLQQRHDLHHNTTYIATHKLLLLLLTCIWHTPFNKYMTYITTHPILLHTHIYIYLLLLLTYGSAADALHISLLLSNYLHVNSKDAFARAKDVPILLHIVHYYTYPYCCYSHASSLKCTCKDVPILLHIVHYYTHILTAAIHMQVV